MNKIDTRVRHVTKLGANLFVELGFAPDDAKRYQAESREKVDQALALKEQQTGGTVALHATSQAPSAESP